MKLSLADKLALIYTSAGSMRNVAGLTGLTHQQVGRILHKAAQGQSIDYYEKHPEISSAVDVALEIHKDISRGVAKRHALPFNGSIPVFAERLELSNQGVFVAGEMLFKGTPTDCRQYIIDRDLAGQARIKRLLGERVGALHVHWLSDRLRNAWIASSQKSGAYYAASIRSKVNMPDYMKQANQRINDADKRGLPRTLAAIKFKQALAKKLREGEKIQPIFTPYTAMNPNFPSELVVASINDKLQTRHSPAVGKPGTVLADQILLQVDTRKRLEDDKTKPTKARRDTRSNRSSATQGKARSKTATRTKKAR